VFEPDCRIRARLSRYRRRQLRRGVRGAGGVGVRGRLAEIATPVLAVAGDYDSVLAPSVLEYIASGVQSRRLVVLDGVAHLAPAEAPDRVADLIMQHAGDPPESNDRSTDRKN